MCRLVILMFPKWNHNVKVYVYIRSNAELLLARARKMLWTPPPKTRDIARRHVPWVPRDPETRVAVGLRPFALI